MLMFVQIESEGKPVTDQKSSGRCWIFALLNCMRIPVIKQLKLEDLEFSQNYLFFWDKVKHPLLLTCFFTYLVSYLLTCCLCVET